MGDRGWHRDGKRERNSARLRDGGKEREYVREREMERQGEEIDSRRQNEEINGMVERRYRSSISIILGVSWLEGFLVRHSQSE